MNIISPHQNWMFSLSVMDSEKKKKTEKENQCNLIYNAEDQANIFHRFLNQNISIFIQQFSNLVFIRIKGGLNYKFIFSYSC